MHNCGTETLYFFAIFSITGLSKAAPWATGEYAEIYFEISEADMDLLRRVKPLDYGDFDIYPVYGGKM